LVRYHGGKWKLAPWIISYFPEHRTYVEPFGGGGSVLIRKERCYAEVYNDLDGEIVNLFRVARDYGEELHRKIELTPFARDEFEESYLPTDDMVEQARRTLVRSFQGFGSAAVSKQRTGFRANSNRSGTTPAHDWANYPEALEAVINRLKGVVIENRDAVDCMRQHDSSETLFYVDPPYVLATRYMEEKTSCYKYEMTDEQHTVLATALRSLKGMVLVSGYPCELYDDQLFSDWERIERRAFADGSKERTEVIWMNEACRSALEQSEIQQRMFA
jgi:DNA adenine methylase